MRGFFDSGFFNELKHAAIAIAYMWCISAMFLAPLIVIAFFVDVFRGDA